MPLHAPQIVVENLILLTGLEAAGGKNPNNHALVWEKKKDTDSVRKETRFATLNFITRSISLQIEKFYAPFNDQFIYSPTITILTCA